jgi:hypothetical protein
MSEALKVYGVFHQNNWPMSQLLHDVSGIKSILSRDYTHVANVTARSLDQVWEIIKDKGDVGEGADNWQCWEKHPAVDVLATINRSTCKADVVIEPNGEPHYAGKNGFDYFGGGYDAYIFDVLCVMSMAREKNKPGLWQRVHRKCARAAWIVREFYRQ